MKKAKLLLGLDLYPHVLKLIGLMTLMLFISEVSMAKNNSAEVFFTGTQLTLAQAIAKGDEHEVEILSGHTDLNRPGAKDMTLLFFAMQYAFGKNAKSLDIVTGLVRAGANPLQQVPDLGSAAEASGKSDDPVFMAALIKGGMSPNAEVDDTPIIFSTASEHSQRVMAYLVSKGADVNKKDSLGQTVLIESLSGFQLDNVIWLLQHGADPRVTTDNGWGFNNMLSKIIARQSNVKNSEKLELVRKLAISKGMKWPPADY
ncbi:ankyrin repeat domain-containing protein [Erwiniaceae bacterium L1_54_3]|nr:ankyrin repeat domain-containing protein [Pantoea formicae]MDF7647061.1 ankyrin repeat domain-containing protein [Erwiniaceae bacterium L1_54_3]